MAEKEQPIVDNEQSTDENAEQPVVDAFKATDTTFEALGVSGEILKAIQEMGYVTPMPVQEKVIPYLLGHNNDVVALAQTGTGKTAAYGLPVLQKIDTSRNDVQAIIMAPTRELCLQITDDLKDYSKYIKGLHVLAVYGGASIEPQIRALKKGVQVIVATPGRLVDLMERKVAKLGTVENVVLDEADEMLNMGFSESIDTILAGVPAERNTLLFSATMSKEIERISKNYLHDAKEIVVGSRNEGAEHVNHIYYMVSARDKYNALKRVADYYPEIYAIIFCRTRMETQEIADKLIRDGYNAESLHGELSQAQRDLTMQKFRQHRVQLLVATDVAARGLDVDELTHVINYGLPDDIESYTHRSGRTGRAGRSGTSISIIHVKEKRKVRDIENQIKKKFVPGILPTGQEICAKQLYKVIDDIEKVEVDEEEIAPFLPEVYRKFDMMEKEDLIKRMVSMEFNTFLNYYKNAPEIIQPSEKGDRGRDRDNAGGEKRNRGERRSRGGERSRTAEAGYTRLFINLGKKDGINPKVFMGFINRVAQGQHIDLGRIDLMQNFSFFEVPEQQTGTVLHVLNGTDFDGRKVNVEVTDQAEGQRGGDKKRGGKEGGSFRSVRGERTNRKEDRRDRRENRSYGEKKGKKGSGIVRGAAAKPSREERGQKEAHTPKGAAEWAKFFEGQVEGQPFYDVFKKKKKK
ncbi:MAG: DEAD/DEAH box helicase [Bacteroidaceae bacterium]|nr:DEAD/DEAH box helicase [Bacteroidaceae bacterium]